MNVGQLAKGAGGGAAGGVLGGPVGIAIGAGAGLLASIFGSKSQAKSADKALAAETSYGNRALDAAREERDYQRSQDTYLREQNERTRATQDEERAFARGEKASYRERLSPFRSAGVNAVNRLDRSLAGNMAASVPTNGSSAGGMVQMKAPNGFVKAIPAHLVGAAEAKGAVRI